MTRRFLAPGLLLVAGCGDAARPQPAVREARQQEQTLDEFGYADYSEREEVEEDRVRDGVVLFDHQRSIPGYTLCTDIPNARARLLTAEGAVVREWHDPTTTHWDRAELARNGDLFVIAAGRPRPSAEPGAAESPESESDPGGAEDAQPVLGGRQLVRFGFDGALLWRRHLAVHHDLEELADGRILVLTDVFIQPGEPFSAKGIKDNVVALLEADGSSIAEVSLFEILDSAADFEWGEPPGEPVPRAPLGLLHCNSLQWLERTDLPEGHPLREPGTVLVSSRHQNAVFAFHWDRRELVWLYGPGELQGQHEAKLLANGHVLLLDNGFPDRRWSRVLEIDPLSNRIVWEWGRPRPQGFYTSGRGMVQALAGDNVLVVSSDDGEIFEITRAGDLVWRYLNPVRHENGVSRATMRAQRYPPELVEPLLETR